MGFWVYVKKDKSDIFYIGYRSGKVRRLANILECRVGKFPTRYLSLLLTNKAPKKENYFGIFDKV